jgi:O-antigen/teichoic acid export membrane protein
MINNVAAVIISVLLNLWLIPRYGIVGAAASWSVAIAGFNIVRVVQVKVLMGMLPVDKSLWKGLTAGVVATIIGLTVAALTDGFVALVAGSAAILLAYFGALTLLGIDADDRLVLASLRRKFGLGGRASRRSPSRGSL